MITSSGASMYRMVPPPSLREHLVAVARRVPPRLEAGVASLTLLDPQLLVLHFRKRLQAVEERFRQHRPVMRGELQSLRFDLLNRSRHDERNCNAARYCSVVVTPRTGV